MNQEQIKKWQKHHPIGTNVIVRAKAYLIEEYGNFRQMSVDTVEASVIISGPFKFCERWCVKLIGYQNQPIFISRIERA